MDLSDYTSCFHCKTLFGSLYEHRTIRISVRL
jgi:hypothetical protein